MDERTNGLLSQLDFALLAVARMVEALCREAHVDGETIARVLAEPDAEHLEIITDTVGEVLVKAQDVIVEARRAIWRHREGNA